MAENNSENKTLSDSENKTLSDSENKTLSDSENKTLSDSENKTLSDSENKTLSDSENKTLSDSENKTLSDSENKTLSKLDIDRPQDFKFHIAYEVYSQAWDDNGSESIRTKLNELISYLSNEGHYGGFYAQMKPYRRDLDSFSPGRQRIQGQKKRAWAKDDAKARRNRRYK